MSLKFRFIVSLMYACDIGRVDIEVCIICKLFYASFERNLI